MNQYLEQLEIQKRKLLKALKHLEYSYGKIQNLAENVETLNEDDLAIWESFAARFARVADMFLSRYLRTVILANDPGFIGTLRDMVNQGEKLGLIDNTDAWMSIRELRNIAAHDYSEKDLSLYFAKLRREAPRLLKIKQIVNNT